MLNQSSIDAVNSSKFAGEFLKPLYSTYNFANIVGTIEKTLKGNTTLGTLPDDVLKNTKAENIILLFIDALGWRFLEEVLFGSKEFEIFEKEAKISKLTSMFPSNTSVHVTNVNTGLYPNDTKIYEHRIYNAVEDNIVDILKGTYSYKKGVVNNIENIYPKSEFYNRLESAGIETYTVMGDAYAFSNYNNSVMYGSKRFGYTTLIEGFGIVKELIETRKDSRKYINFYMNNVDELAHKYGATSQYVRDEIKYIFQFINEYLVDLALTNENTSLLIIADHGQDEFDPEETLYLNLIEPKLENMLRENKNSEKLLPAGSVKDMFLHIKDANIDEAYGIIQNIIGENGYVFRKEEFFEKKLFGNMDYDNAFKNIVGDIIILTKDNKCVWWFDGHKKSARGQHGGLSRVQAEIPFIVL